MKISCLHWNCYFPANSKVHTWTVPSQLFRVQTDCLVLRRLRGDLTDVYKYWTRVWKEDGARLLSVMHSEWTRENGHKVECKKFCLNIRRKKLFCCNGDQTLEQFAERLRHPCAWRYSKLNWIWSWVTYSRWPCFEQGDWTRWSFGVPSVLNRSMSFDTKFKRNPFLA